MISLHIDVDKDLRDQAQHVVGELGMDLTTAIQAFLRQLVQKKALPFPSDADPFYSPDNLQVLKTSIAQAQAQAGHLIHKTFAELEGMAQ